MIARKSIGLGEICEISTMTGLILCELSISKARIE